MEFMLKETNEIKLIGKFFPGELKNKLENNIPFVYFSLMTINPNNVVTVLRCKAEGEIAEEINNKGKENDTLELIGYLESKERENIIKVLKFAFVLEKDQYCNQVSILGKVISDPEAQQKEENEEQVASFKIRLLSEKNFRYFPIFYCRAQGEMAKETIKIVKKDYIILIKGFLQTKKIIKEENEEKKISRISLIVLQSFTCFEEERLIRISKEVRKIDFTNNK